MVKNKYLFITSLAFLVLTTASGTFLASSSIFADDSVVDEVNVTVPVSCSLSSTGTNSHSAEINLGTYNSSIGETTISTFCNDNEGFAIYAVGFTDDEPGKNVLTSTTLGSSHDIATGTATSGSDSAWAMKLATISNPVPTYPIVIAGSNADTLKEQGDPDFTTFQAVPSRYTKVAYRLSGTDTGANAEGSTFTTTYQAYISPTQPAGTYNGKVKYTLVHPSSEAAPTLPETIDPPTSCNTPVPNIKYMQDINSSNKATVLASLTEDAPYYLRDSRDGEPYCVSKLKDGNLWLLDNLRLDLNNTEVLANVTAANTNASATSLNYMKNGGGTISDQYATAPINSIEWNYENGDQYSIPMTSSTYKDEPNNEYGNGSHKTGVYYNYCAASAGSYCYGNGTNGGTSVGNATEDICPAGWRMPTGGPNGEYDNLAIALGLTPEFYSADYYEYQGNEYLIAISTTQTGMFYGGWPDTSEGYGLYWSSTRSNNNSMYDLEASHAYPQQHVDTIADYSARSNGVSMRCLLQ